MQVVWPTEYRYKQSGHCRNTGVHSIMMDKSALSSEGGVARPLPFTLVTITYKVAMYAPAERADTLTLFHLYNYMYSVVWPLLW
jgi:hypothetical protein